MTVVQFWIDYNDSTSQREVNAWQLIATDTQGNGGKREALEYLNREVGILCFSWLKKPLNRLRGPKNENCGCVIPIKRRAPLTGIRLETDVNNVPATYLKAIDFVGIRPF